MSNLIQHSFQFNIMINEGIQDGGAHADLSDEYQSNKANNPNIANSQQPFMGPAKLPTFSDPTAF
jgi:hypothetical protein